MASFLANFVEGMRQCTKCRQFILAGITKISGQIAGKTSAAKPYFSINGRVQLPLIDRIRYRPKHPKRLTPLYVMKRILLTIAFVLGNANFVQAQTSFTDATAIGVWNTTRWNNSTDGPSYTSTYTVANAVSFTAGTYSIAGMGASINVGNVTVTNGVTVSFTANANTFATGGNIRTLDVGASGLLDFSSQAISTAAGTGFIKNGAGVLALNGSSYAGGFTLNSGTVVVRGVNAMGSGGSLTINGGVIAANGNRDLTGKYGGGITVGGDFILGASTGLASARANLTFSNN